MLMHQSHYPSSDTCQGSPERLVTTLGCKEQIWHSRKVNQLAAKVKDSLSSRDRGHNDFDGNRWHNLQQNCETRNDFCGRLVCLCQWSCPKAENKGWLRPICAGAEPTWYHPRRVNPGKYHQWEISAAYRVFFYAGWILLDGLKSCAKKHFKNIWQNTKTSKGERTNCCEESSKLKLETSEKTITLSSISCALHCSDSIEKSGMWNGIHQ